MYLEKPTPPTTYDGRARQYRGIIISVNGVSALATIAIVNEFHHRIIDPFDAIAVACMSFSLLYVPSVVIYSVLLKRLYDKGLKHNAKSSSTSDSL